MIVRNIKRALSNFVSKSSTILDCSIRSIHYSSVVASASNATSQASIAKYVPRRALLYVPASNKKMIDKVPQIQVDCLVLELEDGVAQSAKAEARINAREYLDKRLNNEKRLCRELGIRVNSVASGMLHDDLTELSKSTNLPQAFMVPKIDSIDDLHTVWQMFTDTFGRDRVTNTSTKLVIWIESARALINMPAILNAAHNLHRATAFFRVDAVVFGSDDFCANIGATRSKEGSESLYARQYFVTCCKAFDMQAIDSVYIDINDMDGLKAQCDQGKAWGFNGKQVIHPMQIPIVQKGYSPTQERIEWANELICKYNEHANTGTGAFTFRGQMIDKPLLLQAQHIVDIAEYSR